MDTWPTLPKLPYGMCAPVAPADENGFARPFVKDDGDVRSLHFTHAELQSRMDSSRPWWLTVDYTRTMMGFLLLHKAPVALGMIGLGGGSLAKFCHHELADCSITVAENNPHVIALRRSFRIPEDSDRFEVLEVDGATFVATCPDAFDVLLVDGFDQNGQAPSLCTQAFYDGCFAALKPDGVLVVNLHQDDGDYTLWVERVLRSFAGNAVEIPAPEKSNCIMFASRGALLSPRRINLNNGLSRLGAEGRAQLKQEFARIAWCMKDLGNSS
jgi:spermidine synthase